ncbi:MAG: hypothetical protein H6707_07865 [Deltaproteobacteria bacterium]|nr:hypothetical protein [Deltaproteobacteria bacterium]
MRQLASAVLSLALFASTAASAATKNPHLKRGIQLFSEMEDQTALEALDQAARWPQNTATDRANIEMYRALIYANTLQPKMARAAFFRALDHDAAIALPSDISPKIRDAFDGYRRDWAEKRAQSQPPPSDHPQPPKDPPKVNPPAAETPSADGPRPWYKNWVAWTLSGVAVASAGAGIGLGLAAKSDEDAAKNPNLPFPEAQSKNDSAKSKALGANITFGLAGAAAVAATVLFILNKPGGRTAKHEKAPRSEVTPFPGGASLTIHFH